jgi:hypothetical protein
MGPSAELAEAAVTDMVPPKGTADVAAQESEANTETATHQAEAAAVGPSSTPSEETTAAILISDSPVQEERQDNFEQAPESPVVLITARTNVPSPTTGLVSGGTSIRLPSLPPSPQPSNHEEEEEEELSYSDDDFGINLDVNSQLPDPSKFSNFSFEDFDADFPLEGNFSFLVGVGSILSRTI